MPPATQAAQAKAVQGTSPECDVRRACVEVPAAVAAAVEDGAGEAADGDDDLQVLRPHRVEGELRGFLVALAVAPGFPAAAAEKGSQKQSGRLRRSG